MRAKKIFENINFERGKDPKSALNIGVVHEIAKRWDAVQRESGVGSIDIKPRNVKGRISGENMDFAMHVTLFPGAHRVAYEAALAYLGPYLEPNYRIDSHYTLIGIKEEFIDAFISVYNSKYPDWPIKRGTKTYESLKFERGRDPKASIGIGNIAQIKEYCEKIISDPAFSALEFSLESGHLKEIIKNEFDRYLIICAYSNQDDYAKYLLNQKLFSSKRIQEEIFRIYVKLWNYPMIDLMLDKGIDIDCKDPLGYTSFHKETIRTDKNNFQSKNILDYLLGKGADINTRDRDLTTPLINAVFGGNIPLVTYLLKKGADPNIRDSRNMTALSAVQTILSTLRRPIQSLLVKHGAKVY